MGEMHLLTRIPLTKSLFRFPLMTALVTTMLDQLSKHWLLFDVGMIDRAPITITTWFSIVMVWNKGVSFGMFAANWGWGALLLIAVALMIIGVLVFYAISPRTTWLERLAYGMIIGGAVGNVIDRVRYGAVADFFYFHIGDLGWPAFNIADSAICIGVGILLLTMMKGSKVTA